LKLEGKKPSRPSFQEIETQRIEAERFLKRIALEAKFEVQILKKSLLRKLQAAPFTTLHSSAGGK